MQQAPVESAEATISVVLELVHASHYILMRGCSRGR